MGHQTHPVQVLQTVRFGFFGAASQHLDLGDGQIFGHAEMRKQLKILEHHADPAAQLGQVGFGVVHRQTIDKDLTLLERLQRVDGFDQRGFAGARGAADHHDLAFFDAGGAVVQHLHRTVPLGNVF